MTIYDVEADKMLVTMKTGWRGKDVQQFILEQPAVLELEWNSKKFHPEHVGEDTKRKLRERKQKQKKKEQRNTKKRTSRRRRKNKNKKKRDNNSNSKKNELR